VVRRKDKIELSYEEKFKLARERFLASSKLNDDAIEAAITLNKELHTLTADQLFKEFGFF
jgi:hypothetical protein